MLYKHQLDIIREDKPKTGLFLGTGSGKTLTALSLARGKTLIICPKTQKEDRNWEREAQKSKISLDITVMSKEVFRAAAATLKPFDTVIVDEAHTCLGVTPNIRWIKKVAHPRCSQLFDNLAAYLNRTNPERLYLVTATVMKSPMTVWGAGKLLGHNWNFYEFREMFYIKLPMPGREVWVPKKDSATKTRLAQIIRTIGYTGQLSDYFDVPDQVYKTIFLELTEKQKQRIKELKTEYPDPLVLLGKKHQVENGVLAGDEFNAPEEFDSQKLEKIGDLAAEFPRMVVFAKYTAQIAQISRFLGDQGYKVITLEGSTKDRGGAILEANSSPECVFIAQAQISSGWELPDYPVMVFASMSYSIVDRIQGEGRILRANRLKKNLFIDLVVRGGIDEAVYESIKQKKDFNERVYLNI